MSNPSASITYRPGEIEDSYSVFLVFEEALADLLPRIGINEPTSFGNPEAIARIWVERQGLFEHLARSAEHFWIAEQDGHPVGFARSTLRDGILELTEFFVKPNIQSGGVGRTLFERVFPEGEYRRRVIIATTDLRAQARYLKSGVYPRFPLMYFGKTPGPVSVETDLTFQAISVTPETLEKLDALDEAVIGFKRRVDHTWLLTDRQGWLYLQDGNPVGYGYTGTRNGPFALLHPVDFPVVLAHAEHQAVEGERAHVGVEVPMHNRHAVGYLISREYKLDRFIAFFMSDKPFGKFDQYILTSPPFFL